MWASDRSATSNRGKVHLLRQRMQQLLKPCLIGIIMLRESKEQKTTAQLVGVALRAQLAGVALCGQLAAMAVLTLWRRRCRDGGPLTRLRAGATGRPRLWGELGPNMVRNSQRSSNRSIDLRRRRCQQRSQQLPT